MGIYSQFPYGVWCHFFGVPKATLERIPLAMPTPTLADVINLLLEQTLSKLGFQDDFNSIVEKDTVIVSCVDNGKDVMIFDCSDKRKVRVTNLPLPEPTPCWETREFDLFDPCSIDDLKVLFEKVLSKWSNFCL